MKLTLLGCIVCLFARTAMATELTHHFTDPSLGGNPLNGTYLLGQAAAQNKFKEPVAPTQQKTPLDNFKASLQSAILSQVSRSTVSNLFDSNGNIQLGTNLNFDLNNDGIADFSVVVSSKPANGNVDINISDGLSSTILSVPYIAPK